MKLLLAILPISLIVSSCSGNITEVITQTEYTEKRIMIKEPPEPILFPDTEWFVVSNENFDEVMKKIEQDVGSMTFFAITPDGYENLALGVNDLRRYILQQKEIIAYYEKSIKGEESNSKD